MSENTLPDSQLNGKLPLLYSPAGRRTHDLPHSRHHRILVVRAYQSPNNSFMEFVCVRWCYLLVSG